MSLRLDAVDRLFDRLAATYGREWFGMWTGVDGAAVKALWSHELASYSERMDAIAWALENLPTKCPNSIEFKNLCRQAPRPDFAQLEAPRADPEVVDAELAKLAQKSVKSASPDTRFDFKEWAKKLKARHEAGDRLNMIQIEAYQKALGLNEVTA